MHYLRKVKLVCVLVMVTSLANAADLIIDNQAIPGSDIKSISISPDTGNLFITTTPGYTVTKDVAGSNVSIDSFTVSPTSILAGASATVSWSTSNAVACTASNGVGGWAGSVATSGSQVITTSTLGTHTFTLSCDGSVAGDTAISNRTLTVTAANAVVINSFSASPSSIAEGASTTLTWSTANATSCTASNGFGVWSGSIPVNGSTSVTSSTAGSYSFTLTCSDASGGQAVDTANVTVNAEVANCEASPLAVGNVMSWSTFWADEFPGPAYKIVYNATIPQYGYMSLKFNTADIVQDGKITSLENTSTSGLRTGAISECPGDFDVAPECRYVWGLGGGLRWATNGKLGACALDPNKDYYFNLTYTDGIDDSKSQCNDSPCRVHLQHYSR